MQLWTTVPVNKGKFRAKVSLADYAWASMHVWFLVKGYPTANTFKRGPRITLHRCVCYPDGEGKLIDHVRHDLLDARRTKLRICSHTQNVRNRRKQAGTTSRFKGVAYAGHKSSLNSWEAYITIDRKFVSLGMFADEDSAGLAYNRAALKHFGKFALLNKVSVTSSTKNSKLPGSSGFAGVQKHAQGWTSYLPGRKYLGLFPSIEAAAKANGTWKLAKKPKDPKFKIESPMALAQ